MRALQLNGETITEGVRWTRTGEAIHDGIHYPPGHAAIVMLPDPVPDPAIAIDAEAARVEALMPVIMCCIQYAQQAGFTSIPATNLDAMLDAEARMAATTAPEVAAGALLIQARSTLIEMGGSWEDVVTVAASITQET